MLFPELDVGPFSQQMCHTNIIDVEPTREPPTTPVGMSPRKADSSHILDMIASRCDQDGWDVLFSGLLEDEIWDVETPETQRLSPVVPPPRDVESV